MELVDHLRKQPVLMEKEKTKLLVLIETLEKTIVAEERKMVMPIGEKFNGFVYQDHEKYEQEAIERYGEEVIEKAKDRQRGKEGVFIEKLNEIFFAFAENMNQGMAPSSAENKALSKGLHEFIC